MCEETLTRKVIDFLAFYQRDINVLLKEIKEIDHFLSQNFLTRKATSRKDGKELSKPLENEQYIPGKV